jgi:superfamily II DNA or RNA helicase
LRCWQQDACDFLQQTLIDQGKEHAYICAPTGSGKSRMMFESCERLPVKGTRIIIVGRAKIMRQHRKSFQGYGCTPVSDAADCAEFVSPSGHRLLIITWQGLRSSPDKYLHLLPVAYLYFDECQLGGTQAGMEEEDKARTSYGIILTKFQPEKRINVSATTQAVNESLLGPKAGHFYRYKLSDAYENGYLNQVDMIEVHTGIRAKIKPLEDAFGQNFERLEEMTSAELEGLAWKLKDRVVDVSRIEAVKRIVQHRHDSMMEIYFKDHAGDQALFFCSNIEAANEAASRFNSFALKHGLGLRSYSVNSEDDGHDDTITRFENGDIKVLHVVGMLQEGFDMPSLALAFDCRFYRKWDGSRIARLIQKVGRIMRVHPGKVKSQYYYARDVRDFYRNISVKPKVPSFPLLTEDDEEHDAPNGGYAEITPEDEENDDQIREAAELAAAAVRAESDGLGDDPRPDWQKEIDINAGAVERREVEPITPEADPDPDDGDAIDTTKLKTKRITTVRTPLYVLADVRDHAIVHKENFAKYFGNSAAYKKHLILSMPPDAPRPTQLNGKPRKPRKSAASEEAANA